MARVVVVHGIAQEWRGWETLGLEVGAALRDGVRMAVDPDKPTPLAPSDVACVFYGDVFHREGTRAAGLPRYDEHDVAEGLESDLLAAWWAEAARVCPEVVAPDAPTRGVAGHAAAQTLRLPGVRRALNALLAAPFFAHASEALLILALKQVRRYFTDADVRQRVQRRVAAEISADTTVLVGHSLGSVVAYEALCDPAFAAGTGHQVRTLVTLGSPLGVRGLVFDRLTPAPVNGLGHWPPGVTSWTNIADVVDVVALAKRLAPLFGAALVDREIHNGVDLHDLRRYLLAPTCGAALARGLGLLPDTAAP